ncbi:MAG TPA: BatA domain-containing protein, partial [Ignavibacteria bacterium]
MTFINPAILWGLLAVSIPILIHIFNLKKTRKIEFSTLMFLKEIQETKQKRIKLKQLLILLCRIAFIILIVMAFAGPFTKGFLGSITDKSPATVLILFDDSFSMNGRSASGTDFDAAKNKAIELINTLAKDDEVFFVPVSKIDNYSYLTPYKEINSIRDSITHHKTSDVRKPISSILYKAKNILSASKYPLKEVYIITDGQSSMFEKNNLAAEELFDKDTRLNFVLVSARTPNNISIDSVDVKTKIFVPGRTVKLTAIVTNHNNFNITSKSIVFTSDTYRDEKAIDFPSGSATEVDFTFSPQKGGFQSGTIELTGSEISEDEFQNDNKRNVVFYVPEYLGVLIVSENPSDDDYLSLAISSSEAMMTDSSGNKINFYKIKNSRSLTGENLNDFNAIVIVTKRSFSNDEASKLKAYIEDGGGVIIYPGKNAELNNYNDVLNKTFGIPYLPQRTENPNGTVFDKIDYDHPLFEGMFKSKTNESKIESPLVKSWVSPQAGANSQSLIKLSGGENFLVQYRIGKGNILFYAIPPDKSCSNFPEISIFPPLTLRSIGYVSKLPSPKEAIAGEECYFNPEDFGPIKTDSLFIAGLNQKKTAIPYSSENLSLINLESYINAAGIYTIEDKSRVLYEFPANTSGKESLTPRLNTSEISYFIRNQYKLK